jgi:uncharacterized protein (TIGR02147 family)
MQTPKIFDYTDYRLFLLNSFEHEKSTKSGWSMGRWAKRLGFANTAVLANILKGHRAPGKKATESLTRDFRFDENEQNYFEKLIEIEKAKNKPSLLPLLVEDLVKNHPTKNVEIIDLENFRAISKPHYYMLREMIRLKNFRNNPEWIKEASSMPLSVTEITNALKELSQLGLIKEDGEQAQSIVKDVKTRSDIADEGLKRFHESSLELARKAIRKIPPEEREITSLTLSFQDQDMPEAKKAIREFVATFNNRFDKDNGDNVFQMNIQFIPLTDSKKGASK